MCFAFFIAPLRCFRCPLPQCLAGMRCGKRLRLNKRAYPFGVLHAPRRHRSSMASLAVQIFFCGGNRRLPHMAKGRFVSQETIEDARIERLSELSFMLYTATIPYLDKDGLIDGRPWWVAGH